MQAAVKYATPRGIRHTFCAHRTPGRRTRLTFDLDCCFCYPEQGVVVRGRPIFHQDKCMIIKWHRLFGLGLMDYFEGTEYDVEVEKDLSIKQQFLDVVVVEKGRTRHVRKIQKPCDGLENMCRFNLLTFKSLHEPLDLWAVEELVGHYVNFRKLIGQEKVAPQEIQLYAVCTRHPQALEKHRLLIPVQKGIYDLEVLSRRVRVIVLSQVSKAKQNALWALFSCNEERVTYGVNYYDWNRSDWSSTLSHLYHRYQHEDINMSYTREDFERDVLEDNLKRFSAEKILSYFSTEDRLAGLRPEDRLAGLRPEDILKHYGPEERLVDLAKQEVIQMSERKGVTTILSRQLQCRFKNIPAWTQDKIAQADRPTLETWSLRVLDAQSLDDVFGP